MILKEVTLLSIEEYQRYRSLISMIDVFWWLRTAGFNGNDVYKVSNTGMTTNFGSVNNFTVSVRPALKFHLDFFEPLFWYKSASIIGSKIEYGAYSWTVLDFKNDELYVLCDEAIARRRFDAETNIFKVSELKSWLNTEGLKLIAA
jgi:hypothetical protein